MPHYVGLWRVERNDAFHKIEVWTRDRNSKSIEDFVSVAESGLQSKIRKSGKPRTLELLAVMQLVDGQWHMAKKADALIIGGLNEAS